MLNFCVYYRVITVLTAFTITLYLFPYNIMGMQLLLTTPLIIGFRAYPHAGPSQVHMYTLFNQIHYTSSADFFFIYTLMCTCMGHWKRMST